MNHSYTRASDDVSADAVSTRAFLQQAVDHYPRLAAFCFTLKLPYREAMSEYRSLILRFHTEVWQRTGEYSRQRQQVRQSSPPTILRWMWESASAPEYKIVLLMNLDTLGAWRDEVVQQEISGILREAWRTVTGTDSNVTSMASFIISRTERCSFSQPFSQLQTRVNEMVSPVMTARTGVVCP
ncbi:MULTISPECIES: YagK/YfjJ domain-containing protein [Tenebrionibacter/Tenebrionicola group]|uniref:Inovirus-type Gp2 protein n=2 Tax=Tenebrionibacter/Tenebrionicola group TaxID=2969848 RepID=A0A8K0V327_9ENTR|nr:MULTISPECIES: inovirus-type Gp2 protein [Tenebrionibacter/Tenebrionicola group]MBK4716197.1 inovirus-type Gp2 protein [Tenebrionibacter intestinalis]MBV5094897.1 inovirus-type Gp2 protein [Tenebrionicola larvae]